MNETGAALAKWMKSDAEATTLHGVPVRYRRLHVEDCLAQIPQQHQRTVLEFYSDPPGDRELNHDELLALMFWREAVLKMGLIEPRIAGHGEEVDLGAEPPVVTVGMLGEIGEEMVHLILVLNEKP